MKTEKFLYVCFTLEDVIRAKHSYQKKRGFTLSFKQCIFQKNLQKKECPNEKSDGN